MRFWVPLALRGTASLLAAVVSIAVLCLIQPHDRQALLLVSIYSVTLVFQAFDTIDAFFSHRCSPRSRSGRRTGPFSLSRAIRVALLYARAPVWAFVSALAGEVVLGAVGLCARIPFIGWRDFLLAKEQETEQPSCCSRVGR